MEKVLVAGATGKTGSKVIELLKSSQYFEPIAMVRNRNQEEEFKAKEVRVIVGDLEGEIDHVVKDVDKVIFAAGSGGKNVIEVDQNGAKKLVRACENDQVNKFVMLSSMGAGNPNAENDLYDYLKAKNNADEFLKASKLNFTIVRPGKLNDEKGQGKIALSQSLSNTGEISRDDVAQTLVRVLHDDAANKSTFEIVQGKTLIGKALNTIN